MIARAIRVSILNLSVLNCIDLNNRGREFLPPSAFCNRTSYLISKKECAYMSGISLKMFFRNRLTPFMAVLLAAATALFSVGCCLFIPQRKQLRLLPGCFIPFPCLQDIWRSQNGSRGKTGRMKPFKWATLHMKYIPKPCTHWPQAHIFPKTIDGCIRAMRRAFSPCAPDRL